MGYYTLWANSGQCITAKKYCTAAIRRVACVRSAGQRAMPDNELITVIDSVIIYRCSVRQRLSAITTENECVSKNKKERLGETTC